MKKKFTKNITMAAAILISVLLFSTAAAANDIILQISHPWSSRPQFVEEMQTRFNQSHKGIKINYILGGKGNWGPLFQSTMRDAMIESLPDLTHQMLSYTGVLVKQGIVQPIDTIPGGKAFLTSADISAALLRAATVSGHTYAVPFGMTIPVIYYNMSLLKQAGWPLDRAPETWEEINDAAAKVAALGSHINGGFFEFEASNNWMYQNVLTSLGGSMHGHNTPIGFNTDTGIKAMTIIRDFAKAANTVAMTRSQARQAFNAGTMGVLFRSASGIPSIMKAAETNGFTLQVGAFPRDEGRGRLSAASHGAFIFTESPDRQKAALEYLKWAYGPEGQSIQASYAGYLPANTGAVGKSDLFTDYLNSNPYVRSLVDSAGNAGDWYTYPVKNTEQIFHEQIEAVRSVIMGQASPEKAIAEMAEKTRKLLK